MLLTCPHCGPRESGEFAYLGDASVARPDTAEVGDADDLERAVFDYVYLRDNPAGILREYWFHSGGCAAWLVAVRDTVTHQVLSLAPAPGAGAGDAGGRGADVG